MSVSISLIKPMAEILEWVSEHKQVKYLTESGDLREAHLRRIGGGNLADVETLVVDMSDWHTEWSMPLVELATLRIYGEISLKK